MTSLKRYEQFVVKVRDIIPGDKIQMLGGEWLTITHIYEPKYAPDGYYIPRWHLMITFGRGKSKGYSINRASDWFEIRRQSPAA